MPPTRSLKSEEQRMSLPIRRPRAARLTALLCPVALALSWSTSAQAFEAGMSLYPKGFAGFMSGFVPPQPGLFIINPYYYAFNGTAAASVRDGRVELGVDIAMDAVFVQGLYTTGWKLFGANYSIGGAVAYAWAGISATVTGPLGNSVDLSQSANDVADTILMPLNLSWHAGNWHMNTAVSFYVPTGPYSSGELNVGRNMWAVIPTFSVTWYEMATEWDVSGAFALVIPGENDATDYQSGVVFQLDWAIGKHFGAWEIGIAGNVVEQITDDSGAGAQLGGFRMESFGIGPAINYTAMLGQAPLTISAKWQPDISATNTFEGDVITASLVFVF
jgi:hypothetical protein